jgi:hypothetical protein
MAVEAMRMEPWLPSLHYTLQLVDFRKDEVPFPLKLHEMLDTTETMGFDDIVDWMPYGLPFRIYDNARFEEVVMPQYFSSSKSAYHLLTKRICAQVDLTTTVSSH